MEEETEPKYYMDHNNSKIIIISLEIEQKETQEERRHK